MLGWTWLFDVAQQREEITIVHPMQRLAFSIHHLQRIPRGMTCKGTPKRMLITPILKLPAQPSLLSHSLLLSFQALQGPT